MDTEYDKAKNAINVRKHGISLAEAEKMDFDAAIVKPDNRKHYGEPRFIATVPIGTRLYLMVFTPRGRNLRIISLRKANAKERKDYEKEKGPNHHLRGWH